MELMCGAGCRKLSGRWDVAAGLRPAGEEQAGVSIVVEGALVLILAGIAAIVVALGIRLFRGSGDRAAQAEDARVIQEIYQGLSRLEKRIETLETILFDRRREGQ
jgi:phage shock protein B